MTRAIRTVVGLALIGVSALALCWAIYNLIRTGSCASGGVYVSRRECPEGTGLQIMALIGGIFGALIGAGLSPLKGSAGVAWGLTFTMFGLGAIVAGVGPAAPHDTGLAIFGIAFGGFMILMGLGGFGAALVAGRGYRAARSATQQFGLAEALAARGGAGTPVINVQGGSMTPEQTARVTESLKSIGLADVAGMVEDAMEQSQAATAAWSGQVAPTASAPGVPAGSEDLSDELAKLAELHTSGALTDAEFQQAKTRLLGA